MVCSVGVSCGMIGLKPKGKYSAVGCLYSIPIVKTLQVFQTHAMFKSHRQRSCGTYYGMAHCAACAKQLKMISGDSALSLSQMDARAMQAGEAQAEHLIFALLLAAIRRQD